jgi:hypothetical protein
MLTRICLALQPDGPLFHRKSGRISYFGPAIQIFAIEKRLPRLAKANVRKQQQNDDGDRFFSYHRLK